MTQQNEQFEDITRDNNVVITSKLAIGSSIQGKLLGLEANRNYPTNKNLILADAEGKTTTVLTSGSLNYAIKDGKFEVGRTYKITRLENKTIKGKSSTQFQIQRLKEDGSVAAPVQNDAKPAGGRSAK
jgi:hypothetical protein